MTTRNSPVIVLLAQYDEYNWMTQKCVS